MNRGVAIYELEILCMFRLIEPNAHRDSHKNDGVGRLCLQFVCYDWFGVRSLFILRRLFASQRVRYRRSHCISMVEA